MPIYTPGHWSVAIFDIRIQKAYYFDPLKSENITVLEEIEAYIGGKLDQPIIFEKVV